MMSNAYRVVTARLRHVARHFADGDSLEEVSELPATITNRYQFIVDLIHLFLTSCTIHVRYL